MTAVTNSSHPPLLMELTKPIQFGFFAVHVAMGSMPSGQNIMTLNQILRPLFHNNNFYNRINLVFNVDKRQRFRQRQ